MGLPHWFDAGTRQKLRFLRDPRHYPDRPARVMVVETHFAWVFLSRRHAYKMKKPMQRARMNYRTLANRERACRSELRLNRRLAPAVYIRVVPLVRRRSGELAMGRGRKVVDWLVEMHRLPAARMLDRTIAADKIRAEDLDALTGLLAAFFKRARRAPMTGVQYRKRLRAGAHQNGRDLSAPDLGLKLSRVQAVVRAQLGFITAAAEVLGARGACLREGHGDLRPEHVHLGPPPCVIDSLEFDRELRVLDPAEEMAFLALECGRLGRADVGEALIRRYRMATGDRVPEAVIRFYMSQRAATRAKIAAWHVRDPQYPDRRAWIARAHSYLGDASRHARAALRALQQERALLVGGQRPAAQQWGEGLARQRALQRAAEERPYRQGDQLAVSGR